MSWRTYHLLSISLKISVFLDAFPVTCGIVHLEICINRHGFEEAIWLLDGVLCFTQPNVDNIALLRTWVFWMSENKGSHGHLSTLSQT